MNLKAECIKINSSFDALKNTHEEQNYILAKTDDKRNLKLLNLKKELHDKEMALNAANYKINFFEDIQIKNEDKLNSYRGTL